LFRLTYTIGKEDKAFRTGCILEERGMNMLFELTERKCRVCGVRLTEFEIEEKDQHCMDCFTDQAETGTWTN